MPEDKTTLIEELADSIPGVVYQLVVRPDDTRFFSFVSTGIEALFGVTPADACRDAGVMTRCMVDEDLPAYEETFRAVEGNLQPRCFEVRILIVDSPLKWVRCRALPKKQPDGGVVWNGILTDLTEHKELEAACLKAQKTTERAESIISSQQQLRTLIEAMPDAVFFKDGQGCWLITNKVAIELFGLQDVLCEGKSDRDLMALCPGYAKAFAVCIQSDESAWISGGTFYTEELVFSHDHPRRDVHMTKVPLFNEDGSRKGLDTLQSIAEKVSAENTMKILPTLSRYSIQVNMLV